MSHEINSVCLSFALILWRVNFPKANFVKKTNMLKLEGVKLFWTVEKLWNILDTVLW